jgi:hypothetical protein
MPTTPDGSAAPSRTALGAWNPAAVPAVRELEVLRARPLPRGPAARGAPSSARRVAAPLALFVALTACLFTLLTLVWALSLQRRASRSPGS